MPFMQLAPEGAASPAIAAVLVNYTDDNRNTMAFTFDCAAWSPSCVLLGRLSVAWLLEGRSQPVATDSSGNPTGTSGAAQQAASDLSGKIVADLLVDASKANIANGTPDSPLKNGAAARAGPAAGALAAASAGAALLSVLLL
jgi:hypothetical protein